MSITDQYCGDYDINHPIAGTQPIKADAALQFATSLLTSITVTITHQYTVAFLGTEEGYLKKVGLFFRTLQSYYVSIDLKKKKVSIDLRPYFLELYPGLESSPVLAVPWS